MNGWNEDNFLERLLTQVPNERGADGGLCPGAETLSAVLDGETSAAMSEAVLRHVRHCPDCADLQDRLLSFDARTSLESAAAWNEARQRLDNWLEGFLQSQASHFSARKTTANSQKSLGWEAFWSFSYSRKLAWGIGVAALLVLTGDAVLVLELQREQPARVQVAARPAVPQNAAPGQNLAAQEHFQRKIRKPLTSPPQPALPQLAQRLPASPQTPRAQNAGAPERRLPAPSIASPQDRSPPSLTAQAAPTPEPPASAAAAPQGAPRARPARPGKNAFGAIITGAAIRSTSPPAPKAPAATAPPPSLRLGPDAHLLVALSSAQQLPNGSFEFRGTLLLPVPHAGDVSLDRGAEVVGAGETRQGRTSLAVMEFVVQGARYILKEGSGAMKAQTPGTRGAVQFERSQLLEMWPASSLVYEKTPGAAVRPEPQK
jgi:hypothetical protein